jgi:hypothetical protein
MLVHIAQALVADWDHLDIFELILKVALPIWLTAALVPYIFSLSMFASYEMGFLRLKWNNPTRADPGWRVKAGLVWAFGVNLRDLRAFSNPWLGRFVEGPGYRDRLETVADFRVSQADALRAQQEALQRLADFAGVQGTDLEGRQLDRREFQETIRSLDLLFIWMAGSYRKASRYRGDLLHLLQGDFGAQGLADPNGVQLFVSKDGQRWYAQRQTVTGWWFAVGAAGPPPNQWKYDGSVPPGGFPGKEKVWGTQPFVDTFSRNWV